MKNYYLNLIVRLLLIFVNMMIIAWILTDDRLFFTKLILGAVLIFQISEFIIFMNRIHRKLTALVASLRNRDYTVKFQQPGMGNAVDNLLAEFDATLATIRQEDIEKEGRLQYLTMAFSRINTGIITIKDNAGIVLINKTAKDLLQIPEISDWNLMSKHRKNFYECVEALKHGGTSLLKIRAYDLDLDLSVSVVAMKMMNHEYHHITFKDIYSELDRKEIESWHKLIRILTHEIMNSVTPISSLSETMESLLEKSETDISSVREDLSFSLKTIRRRSNGLLSFIENYRKITRLAKPEMKYIQLQEIIKHNIHLFDSQLKNQNIKIEIDLAPEASTLYADPAMTEQIVINLLKNSIEALSEHDDGIITIRSSIDANWLLIEFEDNGAGISKKEIKEVFVPFFTTKKEGSGIGLSLSRQIMLMHNGRINIHSEEDKGTIIRLRFPHEIAAPGNIE